MNKQITGSILVLLMGLSLEAAPSKVVSGGCRLESTNEVIHLENLNPNHNFGVFARGTSKEGFSVRFAQNSQDAMIVTFSNTRELSYSEIPTQDGKRTKVSMGLTVSRTIQPENEWMSCELEVE